MNFIDKPSQAVLADNAAVTEQKVVNLALQGGGTHGAFTWGVLDRLLEEERLGFDGITATSAGAVNAVLLAYGLAIGGREEAKKTLELFWRKMAAAGAYGMFQPSLLDRMKANFGLDHSPGYIMMDALSYFSSPLVFNPLNYNPLKELLDEVVDFERLSREPAIKLFLCATNVRTGKIKVFSGAKLRSDHVLASTCLPLLMRPVEIEGEVFWDGGFSGNPAIFPLVYECEARDVVMVHLTPAERPEVPLSSHDIMNRMQEIGFNSALIREMRAVAFVTKLIDEGRLRDAKRMLIHVIEAEDVIRELPGSSRLNSDWAFLSHLHAIGRKRGDEWLAANFDSLGVQSTVDLQAKYF